MGTPPSRGELRLSRLLLKRTKQLRQYIFITEVRCIELIGFQIEMKPGKRQISQLLNDHEQVPAVFRQDPQRLTKE